MSKRLRKFIGASKADILRLWILTFLGLFIPGTGLVSLGCRFSATETSLAARDVDSGSLVVVD